MIFFKFILDNPWFKPREDFKSTNYFYRGGSFTTYKHWEIQVGRWEPRHLVEFEIDTRWAGSDHAGPSIEIEIFGFMLMTTIYDSRHWNHDAGRWYTEDEARAEHEEWQKEKGA